MHDYCHQMRMLPLSSTACMFRTVPYSSVWLLPLLCNSFKLLLLQMGISPWGVWVASLKSVQFTSVQDCIYALRKAQMVFMYSEKPTRAPRCLLEVLPVLPLKCFMLPMFVWVMMALLSCFQGVFSICHWAFSIKAGSSNRIKLYLVEQKKKIGRTSTEFCQDNVKCCGDLWCMHACSMHTTVFIFSSYLKD